MNYITHYTSPLGGITLASDGEAIIGLWFDGQKYFAHNFDIEHSLVKRERELPVFAEAVGWLDIYFSGQAPDFTPPLRTKGSDFRKAVWEILLGIPYGQTVTYSDIAEIIAERSGSDMVSAQAVGGAVGHNPISIIIPCHRVVGKSGSLTGYAGGIDRKISLLTLEKADISKLFTPK